MNQEDERFFRENFSADSFSDFDDEEAPQATYEKAPFRFKIPPVHKQEQISITKKHQELHDADHPQQSKSPRVDGKLGVNRVDTSKQSQLKMLEKFKAEIEGIKHIGIPKVQDHGDIDIAGGNIQGYVEDQRYAYHPKPPREARQGPKSAKNELNVHNKTTKQFKEMRKDQNQLHAESRFAQLQEKHKKEEAGLVARINELEMVVREKDNIIRGFRRNEESMENRYKNQIRELQDQAEKSFDTISGLRKQILEKEYQISELKQKNRKTAADPGVFKFEHQIQMLKNREKSYLQTIRTLEANNQTYSFNHASGSSVNRESPSITEELTRLREALNQKDQQWNQRLTEAIENERKVNRIEMQRLLRSQQGQTIQQSQEMRTDYATDFDLAPALDRLVHEIQELKSTRTDAAPLSLFEELRFIRQFIMKLQKSNGAADAEQGSDNYEEERSLVTMLRQELDQYKKYIKQEERNKKVFLDELNLYKEQNEDVIKENAYLRGQLGQMQSKLAQVSTSSRVNIEDGVQTQNVGAVLEYQREIIEMRQTIQKQQSQLQQQQTYIKQLQGSLANNESQKPIVLHPPTTLEGVQQTAELHLEIQRLNSLLETEIARLTEVNEEKARSYQQQIKMYEERIQIYEASLRDTQAQLRQYQSRVQQLSASKSTGDATLNGLIQSNKQLQQESAQLKNQLGALITTNKQLQSQIKQRSHAVNHLWQVKQAEFDNVQSIVNRVKVSSQF